MIGKASDVKISDPLSGVKSVRGWMIEHPDSIVLDIKVAADGDNDYFYIIYKEHQNYEFRDPFEV